jgi:HK97 family phage major capsid protein
MEQTLEQEIIKKADMLAADLKSQGGYLLPKQNARFLRKVVDQPTALNLVRTEIMSSDTLVLNRIDMPGDFLHPAVANTEPTDDQHSYVVADRTEWPSKEVIGIVLVPYEAVEESIEGDDFIQTILDLAAQKSSIALEKLLINGDTGSGDPYLAMMDGMLKMIQTNVVDCNGVVLNADVCRSVLLSLENRYREPRSALRWMLNPDDQERLVGKISNRPTTLGDNMLVGDAPLKLNRITSESMAYMPDFTGVLGNPKGFTLGIRRKFTLESDRLITKRMIRFVLTARVAIGVQNEDAFVKFQHLGDTGN